MTLASVVNEDAAGSPLLGQLAGQALTTDMVLVRFAPAGDSDLDGRITPRDYFAIDTGRAMSLGGYAHGDFDYSGGNGTADDYMLIDRVFLMPAPQTASSAVPSAAPSADLFAAHSDPDEQEPAIWDM
jgi:hypothetical protein